MAKYTVSIDGMSCEHCVNSVSKALSALQGAKDVLVDLAAGKASLETEDTEQSIREAIDDIGFDVTKIEEQA